MNTQQGTDSSAACVEHGVWTPVSQAPPKTMGAFTLHYKDVDLDSHDRIIQSGRMTFHMVGCTGDASDQEPQEAVAKVMEAQVRNPAAGGPLYGSATAASFLYHLGDIIYSPGATSEVVPDKAAQDPTVAPGNDCSVMYNDQFYSPYSAYSRPIFAIAGNHDGKYSPHGRKSAIDHFFTNFCASTREQSPDNASGNRGAMTQPYIYWRLNTPFADFIGLYSNISNGGILDDSFRTENGSQYQWLVNELCAIRGENAARTERKALVLAVHYPPYSGATNFLQRGDPTLGPTNARGARPLGTVLQQAFAESGQRPDIIVSAHAHLYQRLTYRYADGWEIPSLVAGSGGHAPVEPLFKACDGTIQPSKVAPFDAVLPAGIALPEGVSVQVAAFNDQSFGFLRLTIGAGRIMGEFFTASPQAVMRFDTFTLDMTAHQILSA